MDIEKRARGFEAGFATEIDHLQRVHGAGGMTWDYLADNLSHSGGRTRGLLR